MEYSDWRALNRAVLSPFSVGRFRIDPRGEPEGAADADDPFALWIPAHGAFGTGLHASTRGILRWLDGACLAGRRLLDVGCGSGILAMAALRRGAAAAVGFDLDSDALFEARRNLARNRPTGASLFVGTIAALQGGFDVVVANLIWEEAAPLLSSIASRFISGGTAVFSGILDIREQEARRGLGASGLTVVSVDCDGEWRTIVTRH